MKAAMKTVLTILFSALFMLVAVVFLDAVSSHGERILSARSSIEAAVILILVVFVGGGTGLANAVLACLMRQSPHNRLMVFCFGGIIVSNLVFMWAGASGISFLAGIFLGAWLGLGSWIGFRVTDWCIPRRRQDRN